MDPAAKAAQAEARSKSKSLTKKDVAPVTSTKPKDDAKPAEPISPAAPRTPSLFDIEVSGQLTAPTRVVTATQDESSEDEILAEIEGGDDEDVALDEAA
jgi:hypothetical protein